MSTLLSENASKDVVIYVNDYFPKYDRALMKLSQKLGRPLRGIVLIDSEQKAKGKYRSDKNGVTEEVVVDFSDDAALLKALKQFEERLLLISCDSEQSQLYFKRVIPHVPYINTPTESSLYFCTDKGKMRELLIGYDPNISPEAMTVYDSSEETVQTIIKKLDFPLIIKPTNLASSMLVNRANNESQLREVIERSFVALEEIYPQHRALGNKTLVVEEFVEGDLFSVDAYVDAIGKVYVLPFIHFQNQAMVGSEGYQEYQRETFFYLSDNERQQGIETVVRAIHAVGLRSSVAHIELFHQTKGWKIVEIGARAGGWRQDMYEISYGIDHAYNELLVKIGLEPEMPSGLITHSAMFCINASKAGTVTSISGVEEAREHAQMSKMLVDVELGDKVLPGTQGGDLLIEGLMNNTDPEQLNLDLALVRDSITVDIQLN